MSRSTLSLFLLYCDYVGKLGVLYYTHFQREYFRIDEWFPLESVISYTYSRYVRHAENRTKRSIGKTEWKMQSVIGRNQVRESVYVHCHV